MRISGIEPQSGNLDIVIRMYGIIRSNEQTAWHWSLVQ